MRLSFERWLGASPDVLWTILVDPGRMRSWLGADVRLLHEGSSGPLAKGARWEATMVLPAGKLVVEVELDVVTPGARLVYRVVAGLPLKGHRAEIRLFGAEGGTWLRWEVEAEYAQSIFGQLAEWHFEPWAERGLAALEQHVGGGQKAISSAALESLAATG